MTDPASVGSGGTAAGLAAFVALTLACAALLAAVVTVTGPRIAANRERQQQASLADLIGTAAAAGPIQWQGDQAMLCDGAVLLRGRTAGYGGDIVWMAAGQAGPPAQLNAVRITAHQETPGIADFLARPDQGWMAQLPGRTAAELERLDGVSGATITSRAIRRALAQALAALPADKPADGPAGSAPECPT